MIKGLPVVSELPLLKERQTEQQDVPVKAGYVFPGIIFQE
jgi:hypothetical protein